MSTTLQQYAHTLSHITRGIERETIRLNAQGQFATDAHPVALGSALTHPHITTDYAESLLELITEPHNNIPDLLEALSQVHRYVAQRAPDYSLWSASMPCHLPPEADIPIAQYGSSHAGQMRHVYRQGLAVRYGKKMQCIAGVHYNFSLPSLCWETQAGDSPQAKQNHGYMGLIRNFNRYAWLLMYLFGASPAVNGSFLSEAQKANLQAVVPGQTHSYCLPYATSLRMSDLGYKNDAQTRLKTCFNHLDNFLELIAQAVSTPWPAYQAIGTQRDGQWLQLNTHILQIENEFYGIIRPKCSFGAGSRPLKALREQGIQYIEVRCIDNDPFSPIGIAPETAYFLDTFLLYCAFTPSPYFPNGQCQESEDNFTTVVNEGRRPGLLLQRDAQPIALQDWGVALLEAMLPYAQALDQAYQCNHYTHAWQQQLDKLHNSALCPSAKVLAMLENTPFNEAFLQQSLQHTAQLRQQPLPAERWAAFEAMSADSLRAQQAREANNEGSFIDYLTQFERLLHT